mmetsp:Transcript_35104/g.74681  ORF Transcript_35104/g.74681 Transcript_35104/m.74681 type:complete len:235 (-) Transcript_35104:642-1346(-)
MQPRTPATVAPTLQVTAASGKRRLPRSFSNNNNNSNHNSKAKATKPWKRQSCTTTTTSSKTSTKKVNFFRPVKIQAAPILKLGTGGGGAGSAGTDRTSTTGGTDVDGRTSVRAAPAARRANKEQEVSQACPESWARPARRAQKVQSVQRAPGATRGKRVKWGPRGLMGWMEKLETTAQKDPSATEVTVGLQVPRGTPDLTARPGRQEGKENLGHQASTGLPGLKGTKVKTASKA